MNSARANFALIVLDNLVYVFGGITAKGKGKNHHIPSIVNDLTERYNPNNDVWEKIEIKNAPPLCAFSWTTLGPK
jgi:N-acetylneuraminic acid mutarotase